MNNIINIKLNSKEDYINKYNDERISEDLNTYILNEIKEMSLKDKITLEIASKTKLSEKEQEQLKKAIKLSYKDDLYELNLYEKKIINRAIILLIVGLLILVAYYLYSNVFVISEFILIVGWLLIWEAFKRFIFFKTETDVKQNRRKQLINSKIIFK